MWTTENRGNYERRAARYPSDVTDEEWALIEPRPPPERKACRREILNAILYVLTTGCQWPPAAEGLAREEHRARLLVEWQCDGTLLRIHHALYVEARELVGKEASPTTTISDSQSVKGAEKGGARIDPVGYDAAKKIKGKKRHAAVDTLGLILGVAVTPASGQDRDQIAPLLKEVRRLFRSSSARLPTVAYQGATTAAAAKKAAHGTGPSASFDVRSAPLGVSA